MKQTVTIPIYMNTSGGVFATKTTKTIAPLNSSRIARIWADRGDPTSIVDNDATIEVKVNNKEIIPFTFPLRWITSDFYSGTVSSYPVFNPQMVKDQSDLYSVVIDEPAMGSEITFKVYSSIDVIITIEFDDLPLSSHKTKYSVYTISPTWQRASNYVANTASAWQNVMQVLTAVNLNEPATGIFAEYLLNYIPGVNPFLVQFYEPGHIQQYWDIWMAKPAVQKVNWLKDVAEADYDNIYKEKRAIIEMLDATIITLVGEKNLLYQVDLPIIKPTLGIPPKQAMIPLTSSVKNYTLKTLFPVILTYDPVVPEKRNDSPFGATGNALLQVCFTYKEKR